MKLLYNPYQHAFWNALRTWGCPQGHRFQRLTPTTACPTCQAAASQRHFTRLLLRAGRRGGKTLAGGIAAGIEASVPNTLGWIITPTYKHIHRYIWPVLREVIPPDWFLDPVHPIHETHQEIRLRNGSRIVAASAENPEDLRGAGPHWAWFDEACQIAETAWDIFEPSLTEHRGVCWFTTTPMGVDWVHERCWVKAEEGVPGYWAAKYRTLDNPLIGSTAEGRAEVEMARATKSPEFFRQEYEADIVSFHGAIYADLLTPDLILHGLDEIRAFLPEWPAIKADRPRLVGIDPGSATNHPYGAVCFVLTDKGAVVVDEYLATSQATAIHAAEIKRRVAGATSVRYGIDKRRRQDMIELAQHGIYATQVGDLVADGVERVKSWMHAKQVHYVAEKCPRLLDQKRSYRWAEDQHTDGSTKQPTPFKLHDDLCDAERYAFLLYPSVPSPPADPDAGRRAIDTVPPECRHFWLREQRHDGKRPSREEQEIVEDYPLYDFWQ